MLLSTFHGKIAVKIKLIALSFLVFQHRNQNGDGDKNEKVSRQNESLGIQAVLHQSSTALLLVVGAVIKVRELEHLAQAAHQPGSIAQAVDGCPFDITGVEGRH